MIVHVLVRLRGAGIIIVYLCRNFAEKDLAQIQFVYPEAYILRQEKNIPGINDKLKYLLTIQCTDNEGEIGGVVKRLATGKGLMPAVLVKRINTINERLLNIVSEHHKVSWDLL